MDKVILITGADRGLGKVIYRYLSSEKGWHVYGTARKPHDNELLTLDVTSEASVRRCVKAVYDQEGAIDVLINNAGVNQIGSAWETQVAAFDLVMDVNLNGAVRLIREVLPLFRIQAHGRIINITSIGAHVPLPYNSAYSASKAALDAYSESLSHELRDTGVDVVVVAPLALKIRDESPIIANEPSVDCPDSNRMYASMMKGPIPSVSRIAVAMKIRKIIRSDRPRLRYRVGWAAMPILILHRLLPKDFFSWLLRGQLLR